MGALVDGEWVAAPERGHDEQGFDDWIGAREDGEPGAYPAESGRYHLYVSRACPWAHRTALVRRLLGLEDAVSVDVVDPVRHDEGWTFTPARDGCTPDSVNGHEHLRDVYVRADPDYTGRVTVPVLYDTATDAIVNDESADIARMMATGLAELGTRDVDLLPAEMREEVASITAAVHEDVNTAVYEAGFADGQGEYERAVADLFDALEHWDGVLGRRRFLAGDRLTLADVFMFPTLYRFDAVYHTHFYCTERRLVDFEHLWPYAREIAQLPGVAATCDLDHVKDHYYRSHDDINPSGLVPVGPDADWTAPHDRERLGGALPAALASEG